MIRLKKLLTSLCFSFVLLFANAQSVNPGLVLTFDDYSVANWHKLLPIFSKYDAIATFYVCCPYRFNNLQKQMLVDINGAGNELASHGYHHLNSTNFLDTSTMEKFLDQEILSSINWFDTALNIPIKSFSYPFGVRNNSLDVELLKHFASIRGTNYSINSSSNKIYNLSHIGLIYGVGIDSDYGYTLETIKKQLLRCAADSAIQVFYSHTPVDSNAVGYQITYAELDSVLSYAYQLGLSFYSASEAYLPVPDYITGDFSILTENKFITEYSTNEWSYDYTWVLEPENAGDLSWEGNAAIVKWNIGYRGRVKIMVATTNRCGTSNLFVQNLNINNFEAIDAEISLYPNPTRKHFYIKIPIKEKNTKIEVYNLMGELILEKSTSDDLITLSINEPGIYLVKIGIDGSKYVRNVVVQ